MLNFDKIESTSISTEPYTHLVCNDAIHDVQQVTKAYDHLVTELHWNHQEEMDVSLFRLDGLHPACEKLQEVVNNYDWRPLLRRMGVEYSNLITSWQATKIAQPLGPHTDEPDITGVAAKFLVYITPDIDCGTIIHNDQREPVKVTSGKIGDFFMFKGSKRSFHSTNYEHIDPATKRICLVGCFHVEGKPHA